MWDYSLPEDIKNIVGDTPLKRTVDEIAEYAKSGSDDLFGFHREVVIYYLDLERAKEFLKEDFVAKYESGEEKWEQNPLTCEFVIAEAADYMRFGWGKVIDHRGLSTSRTVEKMRAWMWLLGDEDMIKVCDDDEKYAPYGAPVLAEICRKYGWKIPDDDEPTEGDGTVGNMIAGKPCSDRCHGCGS